MQNVNCKINDVTGMLTLAHPLTQPVYGSIIRITDVPDDVQPSMVVRQVSQLCFWPACAGNCDPTILSWPAIAHAAPGAIIRY